MRYTICIRRKDGQAELSEYPYEVPDLDTARNAAHGEIALHEMTRTSYENELAHLHEMVKAMPERGITLTLPYDYLLEVKPVQTG